MTTKDFRDGPPDRARTGVCVRVADPGAASSGVRGARTVRSGDLCGIGDGLVCDGPHAAAGERSRRGRGDARLAGGSRRAVLLRHGRHPARDGAPGGAGGDRRRDLSRPGAGSFCTARRDRPLRRRDRPGQTGLPAGADPGCAGLRAACDGARCATGRDRSQGTFQSVCDLGGGRGAGVLAGAGDLGACCQNPRGDDRRPVRLGPLAAWPVDLAGSGAVWRRRPAAGLVQEGQPGRAGVCTLCLAGLCGGGGRRHVRGGRPPALDRILRPHDRDGSPQRARAAPARGGAGLRSSSGCAARGG